MTDEPQPDLREQLPALMFNAVAPALGGLFVPLSRRKAVADALLAVVQPLLDARQAEVDAWQRRHDDYEQAHRTLVARCAQLVFGARACTHLLRATADRCGTDKPPRAAALRDFADDLDALADDKEPAAVILDAVRDRMLAASARQGAETHALLLAACDANLTGDVE